MAFTTNIRKRPEQDITAQRKQTGMQTGGIPNMYSGRQRYVGQGSVYDPAATGGSFSMDDRTNIRNGPIGGNTYGNFSMDDRTDIRNGPITMQQQNIGSQRPTDMIQMQEPNIGTQQDLTGFKQQTPNIGAPPQQQDFGGTLQMQQMNTAAPNTSDLSNIQTYDTNRASYGSSSLYTADEVAKMMEDSGYFFSDADRRLAQQYPEFGIYAIQCKKEYAEATTPEARALANANLEAMRAKLGHYTGGGDGSEYNPIPQDIDDRPQWDDRELPASPTWDDSKWEDIPQWDDSDLPERPSWDDRNLPARPEYDDSNLPERPEYDDSDLPERPTWDDTDYKAALDEALRKIREVDPFVDRYDPQIQDLLQQILGRGEFTYDYQSDPVWQAYKKQYTREGQRAQADALGQAAAMTGGIPSSYATTAAQQAGNYYASQMSDKIPELYQAAYDRYNAEGNRMLNNMNMLRGLASDDYGRYSDNFNRLMQGLDAERTIYNDAYGRYRDTVGDWYNDRNFDYNKYLDQLSQWNNDRNFDWSKYLDMLGQWNTDRNFDYGKYLDELGQWNSDRDFDYGRYRDQVGDWRDRRNFDYDAYRDRYGDWKDSRNFDYDSYRDQLSDWQRQQDDDWQKKLDEAKLRASLGDYSAYDELYGTGGKLQELFDAMQVPTGKYTYTPPPNPEPEPDTDDEDVERDYDLNPLMPDEFSQEASDLLKSLQMSGYVQNGVVPDNVISKLEGAVRNGSITDPEMQSILALLGAK